MGKTREEILNDIKKHPNRHHHDFNSLTACCTTDGAIDSSLMEAHSQLIDGPNRGCDVTSGPCACGAWH